MASPLEIFTKLAFFIPLALLIAHLAARYTRLWHIPGPLLPAFTDLYYQWYLRRDDKNYVDIIHHLHERYGPVVRWGPNRVSFASTAAIPLVYGTKDIFPKAPSYSPIVIVSKGIEVSSLASMRNEARVSTIKSQVSAGFSQSTWLKQEHQINDTLEFFIQRLHEEIQSQSQSPTATAAGRRLGNDGDEKEGPASAPASAPAPPVIALDKWISLWTFDTLSQLAFSDSRGFLAHGRDVDGIFAGSMARFRHWKAWVLLPSLERWLYKSWLGHQLSGLVSKPGSTALLQLATARIEERKRELGVDGGGGGGGNGGKGTKREGNEVLVAAGRDLVGRFLSAGAQNPGTLEERDVIGLTISTIHAGADTTSSASAHALAHALSDPETWRMLEEEILGAGLVCPPAFKDVASLPVLDAVIRETLRFSFISGVLSERTTTHDTIICDVKIPAGTDISVSPHEASRDTTIYGADIDVFRPQRWLEADGKHWQEMEKASFGFSYGKRICIGRHLAWIEVKKVIATLILSFKISLAEKPVSSFRGGLARMVDLKVRLEPRA